MKQLEEDVRVIRERIGWILFILALPFIVTAGFLILAFLGMLISVVM